MMMTDDANKSLRTNPARLQAPGLYGHTLGPVACCGLARAREREYLRWGVGVFRAADDEQRPGAVTSSSSTRQKTRARLYPT